MRARKIILNILIVVLVSCTISYSQNIPTEAGEIMRHSNGEPVQRWDNADVNLITYGNPAPYRLKRRWYLVAKTPAENQWFQRERAEFPVWEEEIRYEWRDMPYVAPYSKGLRTARSVFGKKRPVEWVQEEDTKIYKVIYKEGQAGTESIPPTFEKGDHIPR